MTVIALARLLALAALLAGCVGASGDALAGRAFLSTAVTRAGLPLALVPGTQVRLTFAADGSLGASAGCNSIGGTYRVEGGQLRFEGGSMTEMGCDPARHAQDDWLAAFLGSRPTVTLTASELTLAADDTAIRLLDREVADPDLPLVGPTWTVDSIITGDAVSSVPQGVVATMRFTADGTVEVATGCNQGGGAYQVDGDSIRFGDIALTKMGCQGPAREMERAVTAVVGAGTVWYAIEASTLTLDTDGPGLILRVP